MARLVGWKPARLEQNDERICGAFEMPKILSHGRGYVVRMFF